LAKSVARSVIRTDARLLADERPGGASSFITDTEANRLIDVRTAELYDKLLKARGHEYYADDEAIAIVAGTSRYNLPSDFYELLSFTLEWGTTNHEELDPYEFGERSSYVGVGWSQGGPKGYRLRAAQIEILPTPTSPVTGRLQYIPAFTDFSGDSATFDGVNGWERWIALAVAIDFRIVNKLPYNDLAQQQAAMDERIEELAAQRDAGHPARVRNVYPEGRARRFS